MESLLPALPGHPLGQVQRKGAQKPGRAWEQGKVRQTCLIQWRKGSLNYPGKRGVQSCLLGLPNPTIPPA